MREISTHLDELYKDIILEHYRNPYNSKPLAEFDIEIHKENPFCGDEADIRVKFSTQGKNQRIENISVYSRGCVISNSSASLMAYTVNGLSISDAKAVQNTFRQLMKGNADNTKGNTLGDLYALESVRKFPIRIKCVLLPWNGLEEALDSR